MIRAIRIRLYPTPDQKKYLAGLFGAVRFCYNKALYLKTHFYKAKGVNLHPLHDRCDDFRRSWRAMSISGIDLGWLVPSDTWSRAL